MSPHGTMTVVGLVPHHAHHRHASTGFYGPLRGMLHSIWYHFDALYILARHGQKSTNTEQIGQSY